jgi:MFS family permease
MRPKIVLGAAIWFYWFSLCAYVPILPTYAQALGASYQLIGVIIGAFGFTQMTLRLPLGIVADRVTKRRVLLLAGTAISIAAGLGMWLVRDPLALLLFRMLAGVAATAWVIQTVMFAGHYPPAESAKAMGLVTAVVNSGEMTAMLAGGLVAEAWGQEQAFLLAAVMGLAAFVCNAAIREAAAVKPGEPVRLAEAAAIARDRNLGLASALGFILQVITYATAFGFVPLVAKSLGASFTEIGLLPTVYMLPGIAASMLSGTVLLGMFGERRLLAGSLLAMAVACAAIPYAASLTALFLFQAVGGFARGLAFPLLMALCIRRIADDRRATAMGFFQAAYGMGMFLGPLAVGKLSQAAGLDWGFWAVGLVGMAGAALAYAATPGPKRTATMQG